MVDPSLTPDPIATMKTPFDPKAKTAREFLVKCESNRGGKYLVPRSYQEIKIPAQDPLMDYEAIGKPSNFPGEIRETLLKRGHLIETKSGDRLTRGASIGKSAVRPGRNGFCFLTVRVPVRKWLLFTKRTEDPKLAWLERQCSNRGLRVVRHGESAHAPILYVHRDDHDKAWSILAPVDSVRDDHPRFRLY